MELLKRRTKQKTRAPIKYRLRGLVSFIKLLCILFIGIGLVSVAYWFVSTSKFLSVSSIRLTGNNIFVNLKDLESVSSAKFLDQNLLFIDPEGSVRDLKNAFLAAKEVKINKVFPRTIEIIVAEREPMAALQRPDSNEVYLVDNEGFVLGLFSETFSSLPRAYYTDEIKVGNFINKDTVPVYLQIVKAAENENLKATSMSISGKYTQMYFNDIGVKISNGKNIAESLKIVSALIKNAHLEGKDIKSIDLRFDKVIVN